MRTQQPRVVLSFSIDPKRARKLDLAARRLSLSKVEILRRLIDNHLPDLGP